jgi:hypothetical protein
MTPTSAQWLAIGSAAVLAWMFGALYYTALGRFWLAAHGPAADAMKAAGAHKSAAAKAFPFVLSLVAEIVMALVMLGLLAHTKMITAKGGLVTALFVWAGFVLTTIWVNNAYPGRRTMLTVIDAGHWLGVLIIIGAVVGGLG